ncbi:uncharacterized protein LOC129919694 [Episyrphus balteatus]|uniref:uncharacterized protein LOC129919694 n=1 Tax=Episyrphus balteatus TaxID=286459 RepID=UPI002484ED34|nr:uncharacterized protein LOC129919694 [Episyrphus balteatus]
MQFKLMHSRALLCLIVIACICALVSCRPSASEEVESGEYSGHLSAETIQKIQKCDMNMEFMELCMRCAKITKSQIVYPLCCDDEDNVQDWCKRYLFFAQHEDS